MTDSKAYTITRRVLISVLLIVYFLWWAYGFYFFHNISEDRHRSCGLANAGMLMLMLLAFVAGFVITLVLYLVSKGQARKDFFIALMLVILPIIISCIDMIIQVQDF
ncbi:MAG: hypothetical protein ABIP51_09550 [Bacteroidia bacterium]